jgi:hypothetical protein
MMRKLFIITSCLFVGISGYAQDGGAVRRSVSLRRIKNKALALRRM